MKTLYVTDLDGTLLRTDDTVSPFTINTVNGLVDKGMLFTYATARSLVSASVVTRGLSARIPVIAYNGAFIYNAETGIPLYSLFFTPEESAFIISLLQSFRLYPFVYSFQEGIERLSWMSGTENEGCFNYLRKRKGDPSLILYRMKKDCTQAIFFILPVSVKKKLFSLFMKELQQAAFLPVPFSRNCMRRSTGVRSCPKRQLRQMP